MGSTWVIMEVLRDRKTTKSASCPHYPSIHPSIHPSILHGVAGKGAGSLWLESCFWECYIIVWVMYYNGLCQIQAIVLCLVRKVGELGTTSPNS
jgi:hypothetical protein